MLCIVRKTGPILLPLVDLMAGRKAGQQTKYGWVLKFLKSLQVKPFGLLFFYYHCNVTTVRELHLCWLFQVKLILRCVLKWKNFDSHFLSCHFLLLGTSVSNDAYNNEHII